jgi:uncharacterized protein DUF6364
LGHLVTYNLDYGIRHGERDKMKREKLTLRLERDLIEKAKRVARERDTSVSGMVAGFFYNLERSYPPERRHGQITSRLRGSLKPKDGSPQADIEDYVRYLEEKHG